MKNYLLVLLFSISAYSQAGGSVGALDKVKIDIFDMEAVRRGALTYVDYCAGCHALKYIRYSGLAAELAISDKSLKKDVMIGGGKVHDTMIVGMRSADAEQWFGTPVPDLSLTARVHGAKWLYSYLRGFYLDETRPFGVNNRVFKDVAMPNVMSGLQGGQRAVFKTVSDEQVIEKLEVVSNGSLSNEDFDSLVKDLVTFLVYIGEPVQGKRVKMGKWVILYLLILLVVVYRLKKHYWLDVH